MATLPVNRIKKKNIMSYNGELCIVLECLVRTPPNNASYVWNVGGSKYLQFPLTDRFNALGNAANARI
jgi:hypothetical protein